MAPPTPLPPPRKLFHSKCLSVLFCISWGMMFPFYWLFVKLLSLLFLTTEEKKNCKNKCKYYWLSVLEFIPVLVLTLITLPLFLIFCPIWMLLQHCRYRLQYWSNDSKDDISKDDGFTFATANLCLMPECFSRLNNLSNVQRRADAIGSIFGKKCELTELKPLLESGSSQEVDVKQVDIIVPSQAVDVNQADIIVPSYPKDVDFLCLQEVFDGRAAEKLVSHLHESFPHIIYDVGINSCKSNRFMLSSGLFIASKYKVEAAEFWRFTDSEGEEKLASKGVLMTKLLIMQKQGVQHVGYLATTHLQASTSFCGASHATAIREKQLGLISASIPKFQDRVGNKGEIVLFDVLAGDFNFDTSSEDDQINADNAIFQTYRDYCRKKNENGQDEVGDWDWVIGTELVQPNLYEYTTPQSLRDALLQPLIRAKIVTSKTGGTDASPNGKRRIDYILRKDKGVKCGVVKKINFVTALASLTDHVSVAMELSTNKKVE